MTWVRVESSVRTNHKFLKAGPAPSWLWLCGIAYCQEGLTDGFIPCEAIDYLGVKHARRLADQLVSAQLWERVEGGWRVHDYLEHNKSAATVRSIKHERREAGARGGEASGEARRKQVASTMSQQPSKQPSNPSTATATPTATSTASETATERTPHTPRAREQSLIRPRRPEAAWEGQRVYVTHRQHRDFVALRGGNEAELFAWYESVAETYTGEIDPDMFAFWRARYREHWPPTAETKVDPRVPQWAR